jgi:4-hydroxybenzoate polyprenyltransferase
LSRSKLLGLIKATHFGPTVLVVTISFFLSLTQYTWSDALQVAIAIFAGQCVVGWTNDFVDAELDREAKRLKKPLVSGVVGEATLKRAIVIALAVALVLSLAGPLGIKGTLIHFLGILSATLYNLGLKKTIFSMLPYIVSFGAMPWAIYLSNGHRPPTWIYLGFILFASAFHFLNVLKDLESDLAQGIMGLPQQLGKRRSIACAFVLASMGALVVAFGS